MSLDSTLLWFVVAAAGVVGGTYVVHGVWRAPQFVGAANDGVVTFGYADQRTEDVASGVTPEDVRWLCRYLGRITDDQLATALRASGATDEEREQFQTSLRARINQLLQVSAAGQVDSLLTRDQKIRRNTSSS